MDLVDLHPATGSITTGSRRIEWNAGALTLTFSTPEDAPVALIGVNAGSEIVDRGSSQPLVEIMLLGAGRARNSTRFTNTAVGARLRYVRHEATQTGTGSATLEIEQLDPVSGLRATTTFSAAPSIAAARVVTTVVNSGTDSLVLQSVSSFATGALVYRGESTHDLLLHSGTGEQLAENRWSVRPLWGQSTLADFNSAGTDQPGRGAVSASSTSTWTTARALPTGIVENPVSGRSLAWQIEHNGAWRWEIDNVREHEDSLGLILHGPVDLDHQWSEELSPGSSFTTVPVSFATSGEGGEGAIAQLTSHRRWLRRKSSVDATPVLVYNDYMNTLNGDPTTDRLLPLIDVAAKAGAEYFCIDAGWYDDTSDWFPSVGEWRPSTTRFPGGLKQVTDAVHGRGMKLGLWLEPEVVGVLSPMAQRLPDDAFLQRDGRRIVEHDRYFLDLRHPAAQAHLDETIDRLVSDFGASFFKLDYNCTPGPGTDLDAFSAGSGLLGHNRAHLAWFVRVRDRHPEVVFENCSSGAMRADFGMLQHFDFQSTSDQEDFRLYPAIAAAAPLQMLPEQAGNWGYAQSWMSDEEIAFTMTTGLSGRLYLSGFLDRMREDQLAIVQDASALFVEIRDEIAASVPGWPLGYPQWFGDSIALTLSAGRERLLYVWHRGDADAEIALRIGGSRAADLTELYPRRLAAWDAVDGADGTIRLRPGIAGPTARIYRIRPH